MTLTFSEFSTSAHFQLGNESLLAAHKNPAALVNFTFIRTTTATAQFVIDGLPINLKPHQIISLTPKQQLEWVSGEDLILYTFNREFYCIKDHDKEVGCAGLLFFGNTHLPVVQLDKKEQGSYDLLHRIFIEELNNQDTIQAEMLRTLMARFIIKTTRLFKVSEQSQTTSIHKTDLLRAFNMLVEEHFRKEHSVKYYADTLYKSPKTLSNAFAKLSTTPLRIIHERIVLEAKRMLLYSEKSTKEVAFELGFEDPSHLSRLFKKITQYSPTHFKENIKTLAEGKN